LALRGDAPLREAADALELRLRQGDQLLDLARALGDGGPVRQRQRHLDAGEDVALAHALTNPGQAGLGRDDAAAIDALHHAAAVRVDDHTTDQGGRPRRRLGPRDGGAHLQQALGGLGHEKSAVGEAARRVHGRQRNRRSGAVVMALVAEGIGRGGHQ
jgi:hypothetical protein